MTLPKLLLSGIFLLGMGVPSFAQRIWQPQLQINLPPDTDMAHYNTKVSVNPKNPKYYKQRGDIFMKHKNYDRAIRDYKKSISLDSSAKIYNNYGVALFKKNKYKEALDIFSEGIKHSPENGTLFYNRGLTYFRLQKHETGCANLKKARKKDSKKARNAYRQYCR